MWRRRYDFLKSFGSRRSLSEGHGRDVVISCGKVHAVSTIHMMQHIKTTSLMIFTPNTQRVKLQQRRRLAYDINGSGRNQS